MYIYISYLFIYIYFLNVLKNIQVNVTSSIPSQMYDSRPDVDKVFSEHPVSGFAGYSLHPND